MKRTKWIYILMIIMPIIDLISANQTKSMMSVTLGMILKGGLFCYFIFYIIFKSQSRYKKKSLIFLFFIMLYTILYFLLKPDLLCREFLLNEIVYYFKVLFLPITFLGLLNFFDEYGFDKEKYKKTMLFVLLEYTLLLIVPIIFSSATNSYLYSLKGTIGWFYSANDIAVIMTLLIPFTYELCNLKIKFAFLFSIPIIYAASAIGTKGSLLGCLISLSIAFVFEVIRTKFKINRKLFKNLFIILFAYFMFLYGNNLTIQNIGIQKQLNDYFIVQRGNNEPNLYVDTGVNLETKEQETIKNDIAHNEPKKIIKKFASFMLSSRDYKFLTINTIFNATYQKGYYLFGMGYSNPARINNSNIYQLVELDIFDLFFHNGLIGLIINLFPFIFILFNVIKYLFNNTKNFANVLVLFEKSIIVVMVFGISCVAGHVLCSPPVAWYLLLYIVEISFFANFKNDKINDKKVAILAMHLGIGGVENTIVNQANMLADNFEVEIVSLYNNHKRIPYKLNKKVKVVYLSNFISNREEFLLAVKSHNIMRSMKESIKAIKILYLKPLLLKKYIIHSDAAVIISTRKEFSKILGKFHKADTCTISEEHNYCLNNRSFVKDVIESTKNIDYFLPASKELAEYYKRKVNSKVAYIPNTITLNTAKTNCSNKKVVSIGRLEKEKGYLDLLYVFAKVVKLDNKITLDIYGDGSLKKVLEKKIVNLGLSKNVFLKGNVEHDLLLELLPNYSLYVCPSYTESFGLSVLEALSKSIPCIYFDDAKGLNEFCNESNSIVIKNRNFNKMAETINLLFKNKNMLKNLSKNCLACCLPYELSVVKDKYVSLLNQIIFDKKRNKFLYFYDNCYKKSKVEYEKEVYNDLKNNKKRFIVTANPELFMMGLKDKTVTDILRNNNYSIVCDGIGLVKGANMLNINVKERIPGVDLAADLFEYGNKLHKTIYLFGAQTKPLNILVKKLQSDYSNLKIVGFSDGYVEDRDLIFEDILKKHPDIIMVALGMPHQEKLIDKYYDKFSKGIFIGVGGSFDVLSGCKKRAPRIFIKFNLEWLYRIIKEPKRIKRFWNNNVKFIKNLKK